jgi:GAF domain-containing protein
MTEGGSTDTPRSGFTVPDSVAARPLQQLAKVTIELGAAETMAEIVDAAVTHMAGAIQAAVTTLLVREGDVLVMRGGHGLQPGVDERWHAFPVDHDNPASEAARTGRVIALPDGGQVTGRYRSLEGDMPARRSLVCLPLGAAGTPVGVAGMTFEDGWLPGPVEMDFLTTFAEACGQAIRRVEALRQARARADQLTFLARASLELSASLDYRATLSKVAGLAVPTLADWCAVDIVENDMPVTVAVAHEDPAKVAWAWELQKRYPPDPAAPQGVANVVRTGVSELLAEITDEMLVASAVDDEHLRIARELNLRSAVVVPLVGHDRTLGAITMIYADSDRRYSRDDLVVAEDLGRRAGAAIDNARLHSQTRDVALQLQRAVLPESLDFVTAWQIATHYEPGGRAEVGGDFYDAVPLADGRLAVFIGDVMGHGVEAAAAMAHVRASVRAFLTVDAEPAAVLSHLEQMFAALDMRRLVSVVYALLDSAAGTATIVNAGHHPPVLVRADGQAELLTTQPHHPLGTGAPHRPVAPVTVPFGRPDTLLLYTDGLIECRDEVIDVGMDRLLAAAPSLTGADLFHRLKSLVQDVQHGEGDDDVTALAVRAR